MTCGSPQFDDDSETARALNRLAREQAKEKLLLDIRQDMMICEIEGWDKTEYIRELQEVIDGFKVGRNKGKHGLFLQGLQERDHQ